MKGELTETEYAQLANKKLLPINVQGTGKGYYSSYHDQSLWRGALLDCSNGATNPVTWIDENGVAQTFSYDKVSDNGNQLTYYQFRSESHEESWDKSNLSPCMKYTLGFNHYHVCVFRCTTLNHDLFRELVCV